MSPALFCRFAENGTVLIPVCFYGKLYGETMDTGIHLKACKTDFPPGNAAAFGEACFAPFWRGSEVRICGGFL